MEHLSDSDKDGQQLKRNLAVSHKLGYYLNKVFVETGKVLNFNTLNRLSCSSDSL